jgi:hypothetical protein
MKAKENPLNQSVTGNPYYDYLIHEVQVVCNCPTDKAMAIVSYVNSLGRLTYLVYTQNCKKVYFFTY